MAAIGAALDDAGADAGGDGGDVAAALDAADKAGELPSADDKKETTSKPDMEEPKPVALEDDNGNKKSEVEILMEKADLKSLVTQVYENLLDAINNENHPNKEQRYRFQVSDKHQRE